MLQPYIQSATALSDIYIYIYIWTPTPITLSHLRCTCGVIITMTVQLVLQTSLTGLHLTISPNWEGIDKNWIVKPFPVSVNNLFLVNSNSSINNYLEGCNICDINVTGPIKHQF